MGFLKIMSGLTQKISQGVFGLGFFVLTLPNTEAKLLVVYYGQFKKKKIVWKYMLIYQKKTF